LKIKNLVLDCLNLFIQRDEVGIHAVKPVINALEVSYTQIMEIPLFSAKPSSLLTMYLSKEDMVGIPSS